MQKYQNNVCYITFSICLYPVNLEPIFSKDQQLAGRHETS